MRRRRTLEAQVAHRGGSALAAYPTVTALTPQPSSQGRLTLLY